MLAFLCTQTAGQSLHNHLNLNRPNCFPSNCSLTFKNPTKTINKNRSIQSLCRKGNLKKALLVLSQEPNPSQHTYELLILACANQNSLSDGIFVHRHILDNGFDQDPFLATKLINMYSELNSIENLRQVFDKICNRSIYVWNAFFRALTIAGNGHEVLDLYRWMNRIGVHSDRFTYTYALKACVASKCAASLLLNGKEIHAHVLRHGYDGFVHIMTTLMDMYARFGCVSYASRVFDGMVVKNVVSWSAMIACYAKNGMAFEALEVFTEMMVADSHNFAPNSITMVSVLQACAALAALQQGRMMHGYVLRKGLDSILPVISSLLSMYARCGKLELAQRVFDKMDDRDVVSWNSLMSGYGVHGFGEKAIEIYKEMIHSGITPSPITLVSVLGACSHAGLVEEGKMLFESMVKDYGIHPSVEHYACMVDLLGRANRLGEAAHIILNMEFDPGPKVWGSLLGSSRVHCNVDLAERASRRLFELEPTNAGNYVLLANVYAEAEMWDDVKRVKKLLETRGLQKVPGRSWIEVKKKIYSFVSEGQNPQMEQLQALLLKLSTEMKEQGYVPQTKIVLYDLDDEEKERILLGHSEKLAVAFGLINSREGETIRITKNLRLCEDCHSVTKFISKFTNREILVRDVNRIHYFRNGICSCGDYW